MKTILVAAVGSVTIGIAALVAALISEEASI